MSLMKMRHGLSPETASFPLTFEEWETLRNNNPQIAVNGIWRCYYVKETTVFLWAFERYCSWKSESWSNELWLAGSDTDYWMYTDAFGDVFIKLTGISPEGVYRSDSGENRTIIPQP